MLPHKLSRLAAIALSPMLPANASSPTSPLPAPPPMAVGINVAGVSSIETAVPYANLVIGSDWLDPQWRPLAEQYQDRAGNILSLPPGQATQRFVVIPPTGPKGIEVRCTWTGSGKVLLQGGGDLLASSANSLRFHYVYRRGPVRPWLARLEVDPRRPFRDLDCREPRVAQTERFRPEFLSTIKGYGVIRFMDWQNANANEPATWATRNLPSGGRATGGSGAPIEDMMAITRELHADPWFVMPWNADDDYIARFARLVAATLPLGAHVYVEAGNEVWNGAFPVARQAVKEGRERQLGPDDFTAGMRRYAQRTGEVMRLWEAAFAGRSGLVRVLSFQHVLPQGGRTALSFGDTARHVDAVATAPYFGDLYGGTGNTRDAVLAKLSTALDATLAAAVANRRVTAEFGKRYIAYEGGEALMLPGQLPLLGQFQHDPAQVELYQRFLAGWRRDAGDLLCLYTSVSVPQPGGSWGLSAWEDETPAEAPKLQAVKEGMAAR